MKTTVKYWHFLVLLFCLPTNLWADIETNGESIESSTSEIFFDPDDDGVNEIVFMGNSYAGFGTLSPAGNLHVIGNIIMVDGNEGADKVMVSDANGLASWSAASAIPGMWTESAGNVYRSSGNVGIGTTSPSQSFQLSGGDMQMDNNTKIRFFRAGVLTEFGSIGMDSNNDININCPNTSGTDVVVAGQGEFKVGMDTLNFTDSSDITIQATASASSGLTLVTNNGMFFNVGSNAGGNIELQQNSVPVVVVAESENVGIGTITPTQNLEVSGNIKVTSGNLFLESGTASVPTLSFINDTDTGMYLNATGNLSLVTAGSDRFIIDADGNVGIGTTATAHAKLAVAGNIFPAGNLTHDIGSTAYAYRDIYSQDFINVSDRRLKKDIQDIAYGLDDLMALNPVEFRWIKDPEQKKHLGFLAQEVEVKIKESVSTGGDKSKTKGVSYTQLVPVIVKALQEHRYEYIREIQSLRKENEELRSLIKKLSQRE